MRRYGPGILALVVVGALGFGAMSGMALDQVAIFVDRGFSGRLADSTVTIESIAMFEATVVFGSYGRSYSAPLRARYQSDAVRDRDDRCC